MKRRVLRLGLACLAAFISLPSRSQTPDYGSIRTFASGRWVALVKIIGQPVPTDLNEVEAPRIQRRWYERFVSQEVQVIDANVPGAKTVFLLTLDGRYFPGRRPKVDGPVPGATIGLTYLVMGEDGSAGYIQGQNPLWLNQLALLKQKFAVSLNEVACERISPTSARTLVRAATPVETYFATRLQSMTLGGADALGDADFFIQASRWPSILNEFGGHTLHEWLSANVGPVAMTCAARTAIPIDAIQFYGCAVAAGVPGSTAAFLRSLSAYTAKGGIMPERLKPFFRDISLNQADLDSNNLLHLAATCQDPDFKCFYFRRAYEPTSTAGIRDYVSLLGDGWAFFNEEILRELSRMTDRPDLTPDPVGGHTPNLTTLVKFWKSKTPDEIYAMIYSRRATKRNR